MSSIEWQRKRRLTPTTAWISGKTQKRIRIASSPERPLLLRARDVVHLERLQSSSWWMIVHRRGLSRVKVGEDPLEARAVSKNTIRGTLPERIVYKYLRDHLHFVPGIDFTFQTSMQGGRMNLGGIVADFVFDYQKLVIQVQGVTHKQHARSRKDVEQRMALEEMGYTVAFVDMDLIYNESRFEDWMRRLFTLRNIGGSSSWAGSYKDTQENYSMHLALAQEILHKSEMIVGVTWQ